MTKSHILTMPYTLLHVLNLNKCFLMPFCLCTSSSLYLELPSSHPLKKTKSYLFLKMHVSLHPPYETPDRRNWFPHYHLKAIYAYHVSVTEHFIPESSSTVGGFRCSFFFFFFVSLVPNPVSDILCSVNVSSACAFHLQNIFQICPILSKSTTTVFPQK